MTGEKRGNWDSAVGSSATRQAFRLLPQWPHVPYDRSMSTPQYVVQERILVTKGERAYYVWKARGGPYATQGEALAALRDILGVGEYDTIEAEEIKDAGFRIHALGAEQG